MQGIGAEENGGGLGVGACDLLGQMVEQVGFRIAPLPPPASLDGVKRQRPQRLREGRLPRRAKVGDGFPVCLDDRHIDGVERGAGHEAENAHEVFQERVQA